MESAEDKASLEATRWLVALQEQPGDPEVRRRFDAWRRASPLNEAAWTETQQLSGLAATMKPVYADVWTPVVGARAPSPVRRRFGGRRPGPPRVRATLVATAVAACLAYYLPTIVERLAADYTTSTAQARAIVLEDGSKVELAPDSVLSVAFTAGERQVKLLSGEAFFQVKHDASRPFRVVARSVETVVVGTAFDVAIDGDGVTVSVEQGIVRVDSAGTSQGELAAGDTVRVRRDGTAARTQTPPTMVASWREGQLVAQNISLRQAVDQLRRYWDGTIILAGSGLDERRITGAYNLADPEDALRGVAHAHGAKVRRITPWILVVSDD